MAWNVRNQQADSMEFTLDNGQVQAVAGGATATVDDGIHSIGYHGLTYVREGIWPFPDGQDLDASYGGAAAPNNCYVKNPSTAVEAVYPHQ